jgi:class 3 adenylate cyclase/YHS domain-containing protein
MAEHERQTEQTFLFADLAGYAALTEAHGDEVAAEAAEGFFRAVRALLPTYEAREVKCIGDAVMIRVCRAGPAVELAVRLIGEVGGRHGTLAVRVGAHTGRAVERGGDWYGAAVNLAARVADVAERGQLLMTDTTRAAAGDTTRGFVLEPRPPRVFRHIDHPVPLFALTLAAQPETSGLPIDPVCHMAVDPTRTDVRRAHAGRDLHFCSEGCARIFDLHPERYAPRI